MSPTAASRPGSGAASPTTRTTTWALPDVLWTSALGQRVILQMVFRPEMRSGRRPNEYHRKDAASIRRDMLAWARRQGERPFFAFLNFYDAHDPYVPPASFRPRFNHGAGSAADMATLERWFISDKKKLTSETDPVRPRRLR